MRNPLRAVWLTNSTAATLDGGTFSVIDGNAFAGEGLMNSIASGERRLLSYAVDLGVVVSSTNDVPPGRITCVAIDKGVIRQQVGERDRMTYVVRNDNGESRDVVIEHRARDTGWTTDASVPAAEVTDEWIRYRITVGPQASASFTVDNSRSVETALTIETITDSQVALYVQDRLLTPALEAALREVLGRKERLAAVDASLASRRSEIEIIGRDQSRLRENMRALKGSSEERRLLQRYVAELDEQETRLAVLQGELAALDAERQRLQGDLARYIAGLSMS
jgi:hypothetical protein